MGIGYDNRYFRSVSTSGNGEVGEETIFHYRQEGETVWASYKGGQIKIGTLVAKVLPDDSLDMRYSHVNSKGKVMTGRCTSKPEILPDGRLRLHESWQWTSGDHSHGNSAVEEFYPNLTSGL